MQSDHSAVHGLRTTGEPLREGDSVVLFDRKDREYLKTLRAGETISIRGGTIAVDELLGKPDGVSVRSSLRERFVVLNREKINKTIEGIYYICVECKKICHNLDEGLIQDPESHVCYCRNCRKKR